MPKRKAKDVLMAAFNPQDDPSGPPHQSVSEQQVQDDLRGSHRKFSGLETAEPVTENEPTLYLSGFKLALVFRFA